MHKIYATFLRIFLLFSCLLPFTDTRADDCPQRYRDIVFDQVKINKNINYGGRKTNTDGTKTWLVLDLYEPKNDTAQLRPLVVLIHGGGFTNFPPLFRATPDIVELARSLARRGYVVVSPEYRLFSGENTFEKMSETAVAGIIDIHAATCYLVNTVANGNPYRIDTSRFFIGGSSAGALLSLYSSLIDDTTDVPLPLRPAMRKVAAFDNIDLQSTLLNKFCGMQPRVVVPISGALVDTQLVKRKDFSVLVIHGRKDKAISNGVGYILGDPNLLEVFGPDIYIDVLEQAGFHVEADIYPEEFHVPVIWPFGDSLLYAIQQTLLTGSAINPPVMDSTQRHMARMFYEALGSPQTVCPTPTNIPDYVVAGQLQVVPNPSGGMFQVEIPAELRGKEVRVQLFNMTGQSVYEKSEQASNLIRMDISGQNAGLYILSLYTEGAEGPKIYIDKVVKQ